MKERNSGGDEELALKSKRILNLGSRFLEDFISKRANREIASEDVEDCE